MTTPRRSIFAEKLNDFRDLAFVGERAFAQRGRWGAFFERRIGPAAFDGRVIFEVGCFEASYLARLAEKFPRSGFIGLDWKYKALYEGAQRLSTAGLRNVILLHGRAQDVREIFADGEVEQIWVFHPDPCDTPRERPNRLIAEPFLLDAHRVLRPGGRSALCLKTDHPGYYQWVLGLLGLPEPAWFDAARNPATAHAAPLPPAPRVRTRDLVRPEEIPARSEAVLRHFDVTMNAADFWNDPAAQRHTVHRPFAGEITLFEARFIRKRLPIYYLELKPK